MHDPLTQAFQIPDPTKPRYPWGTTWRARPPLVTIWHRDPERSYQGQGSDDDSCDWRGWRRPLSNREFAIVEALWDLQGVISNPPFYESEHYSVSYGENGESEVTGELGRALVAMESAVREWRRRDRRWWQHPRFHVHHWHVQVHPVQHFKRWAFSRCCKCGGRFRYGEAPVSAQWDAAGPRWFRGEPYVYHSECGRGGPQLAPNRGAEISEPEK